MRACVCSKIKIHIGSERKTKEEEKNGLKIERKKWNDKNFREKKSERFTLSVLKNRFTGVITFHLYWIIHIIHSSVLLIIKSLCISSTQTHTHTHMIFIGLNDDDRESVIHSNKLHIVFVL